jgi:hypothetical protein
MVKPTPRQLPGDLRPGAGGVMGKTTLPGIATAIAAVTAVTACGANSPSTQTVQGEVLGGTQAAAIAASALGGVRGICGGAVDGTQVIIKGPSGELLATTNLQKDANATSALRLPAALSSEGQVGVYDFKTTIPAGSGPYTVELVGISSLVVSAAQLHHLQLTC